MTTRLIAGLLTALAATTATAQDSVSAAAGIAQAGWGSQQAVYRDAATSGTESQYETYTVEASLQGQIASEIKGDLDSRLARELELSLPAEYAGDTRLVSNN